MANLVEIRSNYDDADSRLDDAQVVMGIIEDATEFHYTDANETKVAQQRLAILMPLLTAAIDDARAILENNRQALIAFRDGQKAEVFNG